MLPPSLDSAIFLDTDTLLLDDISSLWSHFRYPHSDTGLVSRHRLVMCGGAIVAIIISRPGDPSVFYRSMSSAQVMGMAATENVYSVVDHLPRSSKL